MFLSLEINPSDSLDEKSNYSIQMIVSIGNLLETTRYIYTTVILSLFSLPLHLTKQFRWYYQPIQCIFE